jgi:hypothetical protein
MGGEKDLEMYTIFLKANKIQEKHSAGEPARQIADIRIPVNELPGTYYPEVNVFLFCFS